jgi:hypothetical protein
LLFGCIARKFAIARFLTPVHALCVHWLRFAKLRVASVLVSPQTCPDGGFKVAVAEIE